MTHDYKRHGTTTLFAALNVLEGTVIGRCMQRHRHEEFIRFLNTVERAVPASRIIEAVVDNYATHKHPKVKAWLVRHPRWTFHFTPTSGSWLNAVETFFSALTRQRIRRGSFRSIVGLQAAHGCVGAFERAISEKTPSTRLSQEPYFGVNTKEKRFLRLRGDPGLGLLGYMTQACTFPVSRSIPASRLSVP